MFDLGDTVPLTVEIRNGAGALVNATTVALTIELPDGSTTTPTVTNPPASTGVYLYDYVTVQAGRHVARWVSTSPSTAYVDSFDVREASPPYVVSLADVKAQLNITSTTHDEELRAFVEASTRAAEEHRNEVFARRTVRHVRRFSGQKSVVLPRTPVLSLTSISTIDAATSWSVGNFHVDAGSGRITATAGPELSGDVEIVYVAGYSVIPASFSLAVRIIVQHLWETQRGQLGVTRFAGSTDDANLLRFRSMTVFVPPRAQELLGDRCPMVG